MEIIEFQNVNFSYPNSERKALEDVSFRIRPSDFIVLCGKSGCGKSTLLRHMKPELAPHGDLTGRVLYRGADLSDLDERTGACEIGFVQQNPDNQIVTDKVWHELAFGLESLGYSTRLIRRRVAEMASFFGIQTWFRKSVTELSGGQKQLLNLASIMAMQPKLLILDEPTSQLDPIAATEFLETIAKINRELGTTVILSEHRLEEVFPMADKIMVMEAGRIAAFDTAEKVGRFLSRDGDRNPMFRALPTAMKVFAQVRPEGKCPVTVREGRVWLDALLGGRVSFDRMGGEPPRPETEKPAAEGETVIELSDVWFRYEKNGGDIVRDLSLTVKKGELFCLVGGNGVGKTTALKIIGGVNRPYRGKVRIRGRDIRKYTQNELFTANLGVLPQNPLSIFSEATAEEELYEVLYYSKIPEREKLARVDGILTLLELVPLRKAHPYDLSGGEQQRLALGKILLQEPQILLLDEPTKGLDPFFKTVFAGILQRLREKGVTILMVTHDIEFCAEYADVCAMFFDGGIVSQDGPRQFFSGNSFYTTAANRMARDLFPDAITYEEVVKLCAKNLTRCAMPRQEKSVLSFPH